MDGTLNFANVNWGRILNPNNATPTLESATWLPEARETEKKTRKSRYRAWVV